MRGEILITLMLLLLINPVFADDMCPCNTGGGCDTMLDGSGNPCPCDPDCGGSSDLPNTNQPGCPTEEMKEQERQNCIASGGVPVEQTDNAGCVFISCNQCPSADERDFFRNECLQSGGSPYEVINNGCVFVECEGGEQDCPCADGSNNNCPLSPMGTDCLCDPDCGGASTGSDCPCADGPNNNCPKALTGTGDCLCDVDCSTTTACLSDSELQLKERDCASTGGVSKRVMVGNCMTVECTQSSTNCPCADGANNVCTKSPMGGDCCCDPDCFCDSTMTQCPSDEMKEQERQRCSQSGGVINEVLNSDGCVYIQCNIMGGEQDCPCADGANNVCPMNLMGDSDCCCDPDCFCEMMDDSTMCPCADGQNNNCPLADDGKPCCCDMDCNNKQECMLISSQCPSEEMKARERDKCTANGGTPSDKVDPRGCTFISCDYVPTGCVKTIDAKGMEIMKCTTANMTQCPSEAMLADKKMRCTQNGGYPELFKDNLGCTYINCRFDTNKTNLLMKTGCPNETDISLALSKCESLGLIGKIAFENGCKIAKCVEEKQTYCPEEMDPSIKERIASDCQSTGGKVVTAFDEQGCPITKCESQDYCLTVPKEAISECEKYGGQMVTKADASGCVTYFKCVQRGETQSSYIDPVTEVPSATKLLQVSLALETLIMKLDELARQTEGIANYYDSIGSSDALRFRTVSGMFRGVIDKVNVIKQGIRDNLATMTTTYLEQVKHDIQYIKDVVLMDIVYVMLSTGEDFTPPETAVECADFQCFDDAYRICKPVSYYDGEMTFNIKGVTDGYCVVEVTDGESDMTCKRSDYAFGLNNEDDVSTYCEGSLVSVINNE